MIGDVRTGSRYTVVGLVCAALHNVIIVGLDLVRVHYVVSAAVSFCVVVVVGYALHTGFTFRERRNLASFGRYAVAMAVNYPLLVFLLFLMVTVLGISVPIAAPAGTVILFGWNYVSSRWAIVTRRHDASPRPIVEAGKRE